MLFRACTRRLGRARISPPTVHDASQLCASEVTVSNDRAPDVLGVAMNLLDSKWFSRIGTEIPVTLQPKHQPFAYIDEATHPVATERIFAALDMIGRINPSFHDADYIERLVLGKLGSQVWQVREQAARVLASRVSPWDAFDVLGRLVDGMATRKDQNTLHGRLLCAKQILRNMWRSQTEPLRHHLERAAALLHSLVAPIMTSDTSIVVRTTFLDIMNDAFEMEILSRISGMMHRLSEKAMAYHDQKMIFVRYLAQLGKTCSNARAFQYVVLLSITQILLFLSKRKAIFLFCFY
jgi:hypothetical protein